MRTFFCNTIVQHTCTKPCFTGRDVHKDSISVAAAEPGRKPGRLISKVAHNNNKLVKVLVKIGTAEQLHIVYEAARQASDYNAP